MNNNKESHILLPSEQDSGSNLLNLNVSGYSSLNSEKVQQILDYNPEEISKIDEIMIYVGELDDMIKSGKKISNSMQYNFFVIGYNLLSDREKIHFNEIYNGFRVIYYYEKIVSNIKGKHFASLGNITGYLNQFKSEDFDNKYIAKFWSFFNKEEKLFLEEYFEQK